MGKRLDHYAITREVYGSFRVDFAGRPIVEFDAAIELREHYAGKEYAPVIYFPAVALAGLETSDSARSTHCPIKGDASYLNYGDVADAIWYYREPHPGVAAIADHYAFDPGKGFHVVADD